MTDPRRNHTREQALLDILLVAVCCLLCGGTGFVHRAWASANRLVLGQLKTADKSNETTAVPELQRALELAGCIVTADALNCQKNIAKEISEADADYVLTLKANHGTASEEVSRCLTAARQRDFAGVAHDFVETTDKEHGRFEIRRYFIPAEADWFAGRSQREKLRSLALAASEREVAGERSIEQTRVSVQPGPDARLLAQAVRGHWGIENRRHWVLDVQLGEDDSRVRTGHAAENLATLRKLVLNLLWRDTQTFAEPVLPPNKDLPKPAAEGEQGE